MRGLFAVVASLVVVFGAGGQPCEPRWSEEFPRAELNGLPAFFGGIDLGAGPVLMAAGGFTVPTPQNIPTVAAWTGQDWQLMQEGLGLSTLQGIRSLCVFDHGAGPVLYASGEMGGGMPNQSEPFVGLARRVNGQWEAVAWTGIGLDRVFAFDDGVTQRLCISSRLTFGSATRQILSWSGTTWGTMVAHIRALPSGSTDVRTMAGFDDGSGPALYFGGLFHEVNSLSTNHIARWRNGVVESVGAGLDAGAIVHALLVHDDGSGPALYMAGRFQSVAGVMTGPVARLRNGVWSGVASGMSGEVFALATYDPGTGPTLVAGGKGFDGNIASWDGVSWSPVGGGTDGTVRALAPCVESGQRVLFVNGDFEYASGVAAAKFARWNGASWSALRTGGVAGVVSGFGNSGRVQKLRVLDDGTGPALFACGTFTGIGDAPTRTVAKWDGATWTEVGNPHSPMADLTIHDFGNGPRLISPGWCRTDLFGAENCSVAQVFEGGVWRPLGPTFMGDNTTSTVFSVRAGPLAGLYVAGSIHNYVPFVNVARWRSTEWTQMGAGLKRTGGSFVMAGLFTFDAGTGQELLAAGGFTHSGTTEVEGIARWTGTEWLPASPGFRGRVNGFKVVPEPQGDVLYIAGQFFLPGSSAVDYVARWDGSAWTRFAGIADGDCVAVDLFDDGTGLTPYVVGQLRLPGGTTYHKVVRWDGSQWQALPGRVWGQVHTAVSHDDGRGPSLWLGGTISDTGPFNSRGLARWIGCPRSCYANCDESTVSPVLNVRDFGCFLNKFAAGDPYANCDGSTGEPVLTAADFGCFLNRFAAGCP